MKYLAIAAVAAWGCAAVPASAEVVRSETGGFASSNTVVVAADRTATWAMLVQPDQWWTHSWSNNSANLSLDPQAGGCFCEVIPDPAGGPAGSAEHARVVMAMPGKTLRMVGSLGPLQAEGLAGTLTVTLSEVEQGTAIRWDYVIGGQWRLPADQMAPVVDGVQAEFLGALAEALGGAVQGA